MLVRLARVTNVQKVDQVIFHQRQHDGDRVGGLKAQERTQRWIEKETAFLTENYKTLDLSSYLSAPARSEELTPKQKREALINRGVVMGRKGLWRFAFKDFKQAITIEGLNPELSESETSAIRDIVFSKYGCPEIIEDISIGAKMKLLADTNQTGAEIAKTFARSQRWFIRTALQKLRLKTAFRHAILAHKLS
jgi:hypothetical protein